jgi:hypothetical protein
MKIEDFNKLNLTEKKKMITDNTATLNINEDHIEFTYELVHQMFLIDPNPIREERMLLSSVFEYMYGIEQEYIDVLVESMGQIPFILWSKDLFLSNHREASYYIGRYQKYKAGKNTLYSVMNTILDQIMGDLEGVDSDTLQGLGTLLKETMSKIPGLN